MCLQAKKREKKPVTERDTNMTPTWYEHDTNKTHFGKRCLVPTRYTNKILYGYSFIIDLSSLFISPQILW